MTICEGVHSLFRSMWAKIFENHCILVSFCYCGNHKLGDLEQYTFILHGSVGQKSDMGLSGFKARCWESSVPSVGNLGENPFPSFSSFYKQCKFLYS